MNDSQAISSILSGDKAQYEKLVEKYKKLVYGIAWSHLGNVELSEDAAQETFVKAYSYLGTLRNHETFSWWLARIARNVCSSFRRKMIRENAFHKRLAVLEAADPPPEETREALDEQLWESFSRLPEIHREALTIFYIQQKSTVEAAAALGLSEPAMRARLHRARTALRQQMEQRLEDALGDLHPSESFNRSVMILLPLAPKGVALGTGGILACLGKATVSISFAFWLIFAPLVVLVTAIKLELGNVRNAPENKFQKGIIKRRWIAIFTMCAVLNVILAVLSHHMGRQAGEVAGDQLVTVLLLPSMYALLKGLRVNRSRLATASAAGWILVFATYVAMGFFDAPSYTGIAAMLLVFILILLYRDKVPSRSDYNIFLRCATGGVQETPAVELRPRVSDLQLVSYARFLGEQMMVRDYSLKHDGIVLVLPGVQRVYSDILGGLFAGSTVTITRAGECTARLSDGDLKAISNLSGSQVSRQELESRACTAVTGAFERFLAGDLDGAKSILTTQSEECIFHKPTVKSAHWKLLMAFNLVSLTLFLITSIVKHLK